MREWNLKKEVTKRKSVQARMFEQRERRWPGWEFPAGGCFRTCCLRHCGWLKVLLCSWWLAVSRGDRLYALPAGLTASTSTGARGSSIHSFFQTLAECTPPLELYLTTVISSWVGKTVRWVASCPWRVSAKAERYISFLIIHLRTILFPSENDV